MVEPYHGKISGRKPVRDKGGLPTPGKASANGLNPVLCPGFFLNLLLRVGAMDFQVFELIEKHEESELFSRRERLLLSAL